MGIPTLIKTLTASGDSSLSFVDGAASVVLDSTYDEYMFVLTDMNGATDSQQLQFQVNADGESGYNETATTTFFAAKQEEDASNAGLNYKTAEDHAQTTTAIGITEGTSNDADASCAGILHLFNPASTTYVTHFYSRFSNYHYDDGANDCFVAGYFNTTAAITDIQFKYSSGNFDGVIQMYGIS